MSVIEFSLFERGGLFLWPLFFLSILGLIFFMERALFLHRGQIDAEKFIEGIKNLLRKGRLLEALTHCQETPGPVVSVIKAALLHYDQPEIQLKGAIQTAALVEIPFLERRVGTIAAIAKVAPLLGLLGTVVAILHAFSTMQVRGPYASADAFSGDIASALLTTAVGLAIAVGGYMAHHFLCGRIRALVHDMEWAGNDILQFLLIEMQKRENE